MSSTMDIPMPLYRLVKRILSAFYEPMAYLVMDLLVRKVVLSEDEMAEILRFDKKQLTAHLRKLKSEQFVKIKLRMETGADGKASRQNYYFINYKEFVNAIKYKLDFTRKKIETKERDATSKSAYICTYCKKTYTDLEMDQLFDMATNELRCCFCGQTVEEDNDTEDQQGVSRNILQRFNEAVEPIFTLLREIEDIRLGAELLDPEIRQKAGPQQPHVYDQTFAKGKWADKNKNYFGYVTEKELTVKIDDSANAAAAAPTKKEQPEWMKVSTIEGASNFEGASSSVETVNIMSNKASKDASDSVELNDSDEIIQILIAHEQQNDEIWSRIRERFGFNLHHRRGWQSAGQKRPWDWQADSQFENYGAMSCGKQLRLADVDDRWVKMMNNDERRDYIRVGRSIYQKNFEI